MKDSYLRARLEAVHLTPYISPNLSLIPYISIQMRGDITRPDVDQN